MKVKKNRGVIEILFLIALFPLYLILKLVPRNKDIAVFGSSLGNHFADNSKYLFLHISKTSYDIKSVYISKNKEVVEKLLVNNLKAEHLYSIKAVWTIIRAKTAFISHSTEDIHPVLLSGANIIQLWHGTPLRKISYDSDWGNSNLNLPISIRFKNGIRRIIYFLFPYLYSSVKFDTIVVSSDFLIPAFESAFMVSKKKIKVIGQPRNDCLQEDYKFDRNIFPEIDFIRELETRFDNKIVWMPTHRGKSARSMNELLDDFGFDLDSYLDFLKKVNCCLIMKPHFLDMEKMQEKFSVAENKNVILYDYVDPYPLLNITDILITDYSSVYFDFLLKDKPIIFTPFDIEDYKSFIAGFYYEYDDVTPGPKCKDWYQVKDEIIKIVERKSDDYIEERKEVSKLFNGYGSGFSKRIIGELLKPTEPSEKK